LPATSLPRPVSPPQSPAPNTQGLGPDK
jgi:hypothetical protein